MNVLRAVHDDDLIQFLQSIGLHKPLIDGNVTCYFCGEVVTLTNFLAAFPLSGAIKAVCNKPDCLKKLSDQAQNQAEP